MHRVSNDSHVPLISRARFEPRIVIVVVAAVIEQNDSFLVTRRLEGTHLAGLWEFPGGKIGAAETHEAALTREIREELDADVEVGPLVLKTEFVYEDRSVSLHFYRCVLRGTPRPLLGQQMKWVPRAELDALDFPPADVELIRLLTIRATGGRP
jgi:mutator protein MutT